MAGATAAQLEHDRSIFKRAEEVLSEARLEGLLRQLENDHSYYAREADALDDLRAFLGEIGNEFLDDTIRTQVDALLARVRSLTAFLGVNFWKFPEEQGGPDDSSNGWRYCLYPDLNADRGGHDDPEEHKRYEKYMKDLFAEVDALRDAFRSYRRSVKRQIFV